MRAPRIVLVTFVLILLTAVPSRAQESVDLGGQVFMDYFYRVANRDTSLEGLNGFTFRRMNLLADIRFAETLTGMIRFESTPDNVSNRGGIPYVKDLFLRWTPEGGHALTAGISPTPTFQVAERGWGYRSLEATILDLNGVVGARDFGLRFDGPVLPGGKVRYNAMVANNSFARPENDRQKRAYGVLEFYPAKPLTFTVGADFAGYSDNRRYGLTWHGFAGYRVPAFRVGGEVFMNRYTYHDDTDADRSGFTVYTAARIQGPWEWVARVDRVKGENARTGTYTYNNLLITGVSYAYQKIRVIPNLYLTKTDGIDEVNVMGRVTLEMNFSTAVPR